ncbi:---NA--- [Pelobates cultripes]|uniref:---NA n=1 Tax=Pelobates cultripes TaxID=61616 RepID=A0AAD1RPH6_PELCU|nr:---NA--- [Pelobates cultripes]
MAGITPKLFLEKMKPVGQILEHSEIFTYFYRDILLSYSDISDLFSNTHWDLEPG